MASGLNSRPAPSPTLRELAAILFGRWRLLTGSLVFLLLAIVVAIFVSPRYEAHFKVLLRRGRSDPVISPQAASVVNFTSPEITEEELNSEAELLCDEGLLEQVAQMAGVPPAASSGSAPRCSARSTRRPSRSHT